MASCKHPKKDDGVSADGDTNAEVHSDAQPPELATPSPSWKVVAIPCLKEKLDSYDIGTALHQKSGTMTDVTLHRFSHLNSEKVVNCAVTSLPASTEIAEIEVHVGLPSYPVITLFSEESSAAFSLNKSLFTEHMVECIQRQAEKLKIDIRFDYQTYQVKASGSCRQIHKFQEYLTSLAVHQLHLNPAHLLLNTAAPLEQPGATGTSSPDDEDPSGSNSYGNFSPDVLILMPKLREIPGLKYFPEKGRVEVAGVSSEEREKIISKFQETYQQIVTNRQLKTDTLELPPTSKAENIVKLLSEFNEKYHQCHFSYNSISHSVKIVSISSRQFEQAKKLLKDRIAGKSPSMVSMPNCEVLGLSHGRTVTVKKGNMVEEEADILVNAANSQLMHYAGVAGALDKASNGELQRHSDIYTSAKGEVPAGGVAVTKAGGRLKCKNVIHAVGPIAGKHKSEAYCQQLIFDAITKTLKKAQSLNAMSIVLPALSTGVYSVDPKLSAQAMLNAITDFKYSNHVLKDIRIVILDERTYSCFSQELVRFRAMHDSSNNTKKDVVPHLERHHSDPNNTSTAAKVGFSTKELVPVNPERSLVSYTTKDGTVAVTTQPAAATQPSGLPHISYPNIASSLGSAPTSANSSGPPGFVSYSSSTGHHSPAETPLPTVSTSTPHGSGTGTSNPFPINDGSPLSVSGAVGSYSSAVTKTHAGNHERLLKPATLKYDDPTKNLLLPDHVTMSNVSAGNPKKVPGSNNVSNPNSGAAHSSCAGCPICLNEVVTNAVITNCCKQVYCKDCLDEALQHSPYCPTCKTPLRKVQGPQPPGGTMNHNVLPTSRLPGYPKCGTIIITYHIPSGTQGPQHPNPGRQYTGTSRTAYLPDNEEGRHVLKLLKKAFEAGLTFTVGTSSTTGASNTIVWNDIHHKTRNSGGPSNYGYPDPTYLKRVTEELKAKGIH